MRNIKYLRLLFEKVIISQKMEKKIQCIEIIKLFQEWCSHIIIALIIKLLFFNFIQKNFHFQLLTFSIVRGSLFHFIYMKSSRKKHKGTKIRFFDGELEESNHSFEQKYIQKQLEPNIWYLNKKGISADNYQNFVGQLKSHGVKAPEQSTLIATFIQFMSDQDGGHKYDFLSIRGCNKSNNYVRNVVFNRISLEFPDEFLRILKEFLDQQQNVKEKQNLIDKFIDYSKILLLISENYLKNQKNDLELSKEELLN